MMPAVLLCMVLLLAVPAPQFRSATLGPHAQLFLTLSSGRRLAAPTLPGQVAFRAPALSRDRRTVGWLAEFPNPGQAQRIAGALIVYRAGRILRKFNTEQEFWSWRFAAEDRDVAYCTGPMHGEASVCELRSIETGWRRARWGPL